MMASVGFTRYGGPEVVEVLDVPVPVPGPGQLRVRLSATTVNPADVQFRAGDHAAFVEGAAPPYCGGLEFAGVVDAVGEGATAVVGDPVVGTSHFIPSGRGSHAELVVVDQLAVVPQPASLSPAQAATIPMNGLTARVVLESLGLEPGEPVVLTGAAGAVGGYVVELAAAAGLSVVAIASPSDEEALMAMGAAGFVPRGDDVVQQVLDRFPGGVSGVVDAAMLDDAVLPVLRDGGRFITLRPGHVPEAPRGIRASLVSFRRHQQRPDILAELLATLTPRVAEVLPFAGGRAAHDLVDRGGLRGRVVLSLKG